MIEVIVSRLGLDAKSNSYVVVLQEKDGSRLLPIWIGQAEAESIVMHMHNVKRPRPLTHDLFRTLVLGLGAELRRVNITRVAQSTYYADLQVQHGGEIVQIDARPSDSIAIALRLSAPIFAAEALLVDPELEADEEPADDEDDTGDEPGFTPDSEVEEEDDETDAVSPASDSDLSAEQLKRYLETLRPEDFGKFNP